MRPDHYALLYEFLNWAGDQTPIAGIALVGNCASDEDNEEQSDMNFLIISDKKAKTLEAILNQFPFDRVEEATKDERGSLLSLRILYANGLEAEYGIVEETWFNEPLDETLKEVLMRGFKVIWEREELFNPITEFISRHK
ncbi:hypothetical protein FHS15_005195 [Paenibacillus castaneae]|uniref:hypothetical protein n=1 Tax=Paenibacillus castaneae TaxID=474957 RepID=UPI000C99D194|nr:hypothetical protein [Paenibacillus castaneae]NIK80011.1 hypothetical protein [Paenibacillus castaneae]